MLETSFRPSLGGIATHAIMGDIMVQRATLCIGISLRAFCASLLEMSHALAQAILGFMILVIYGFGLVIFMPIKICAACCQNNIQRGRITLY